MQKKESIIGLYDEGRKGQMSMKEKLYIIIPAYNEEANLDAVIRQWYPVVEGIGGDSRLVIIDDGSSDATYEILLKNQGKYPLLQPMTKVNGGHGATVLYGYRYAINNGADYIFQTDSDGQTDPAEFKQFWDLRKEYDAIIGARPGRQDGAARKFVEGTLLFILRLTFGVKIPDSNAPFRLMKRELVEKYIDKIPEDFNLPNVMFTTYFSYFHEKLKFLDISFKPRQGGTNSINIKKIVKIGWKALGDFYTLRKELKE